MSSFGFPASRRRYPYGIVLAGCHNAVLGQVGVPVLVANLQHTHHHIPHEQATIITITIIIVVVVVIIIIIIIITTISSTLKPSVHIVSSAIP